jgi:nondiscriminating glutamyl-tRNA synthetase
MSDQIRLRFPPSPTGHLHIGNVRTALYNWLLARKECGTFILRIEDTDAERSKRESEESLLDDLRWLGLDWNEGPEVGGPHVPYRQSERLDLYEEHTRRLMERGLAYYCFCEPEQLQAERENALAGGRPPRYSGKCRSNPPEESLSRVNSGEPAAVRFLVEDGPAVAWEDLVHGTLSFERETIGDFVIVRSGGLPAYNYAVVVDDALMEISHVIRGDDHISNTPRQILLYEALGYPPPRFGHLPMILGPDGSRLSKRHGAVSVGEFRERGYLPQALVNYLALLGWNPGDERELFTAEELIDAFSLERVNKSAAKFNFEKLDWLNGQHLRRLNPESLTELVRPFLEAKGCLPAEAETSTSGWTGELAAAFAASAVNLVEIAAGTEMVFEYKPEDALALLREEDRAVLSAFLEESAGEEDIDLEAFKAVAKAVSKRTGAKGRELYHPLRIAVTGKEAGPELQVLIPLLEKGKGLKLPKPVLGVRERIEAVVRLME